MAHTTTSVGTAQGSVASGATGTGVDSQHPLYMEFLADWIKMRDCYRGERIVKEKGTTYLPPTAGMIADGMEPTQLGFKQYNAYRLRAAFPDVVNDGIESMLGVMHNKPANIEIPKVMEPLIEEATLRHESLQMLLRRVNEEQLVTGRLGLLVDMPDVATTDLPSIALYQAEDIINWDEGLRDGLVVDKLNFVALNESEFERVRNFEWEFQRKFRVLTLGNPHENVAEGVYNVGVYREVDATFNLDNQVEPSIRGKTLDEIPFVFINSKDVVPEPEEPPLLGLANLAFTIYRGEADYRQALFMQGQDTLVVIGGDEETTYRTGAGGFIHLPSGQGHDAKFIGVDSTGLSEMREALQNDNNRASQKGGQMLDSVSRERESGDALKIRVAARTATLNQVALAGAFGLQQSLRIIARWVGANDQEVIVTPNLDFTDEALEGKTLVEYMTAKSLGAPFSLESIHDIMRDRDLTSKTFEEEVKQMILELELVADLVPEPATDPNGPEEDDNPDTPNPDDD